MDSITVLVVGWKIGGAAIVVLVYTTAYLRTIVIQ